MRSFFVFVLLAVAAPVSYGADESDARDTISAAVVSYSRALASTPVSASVINSDELRAESLTESMPLVFDGQPSVVSVTEGGVGVGYTSFRVRGVGAYQTSVSLDGIPLNDPESQEVFWVNLPALTRILGSVQLQRGLGTSSSGPGAFGAGVSMMTGNVGRPSASAEFTGGSFGTLGGAVSFSTGLLKHGMYADGTCSYSHTDGYIRDAPAFSGSVFARAGWKNARNDVSLSFLQGNQKTGLTWNGVPFDVFPYDPQFNAAPGANDNFRQSHIRLQYEHRTESGMTLTTTLNYTNGFGWYSYPFPPSGDGTITDSTKDVTDNDLFAVRSAVTGTAGSFLLSGGVYLSLYDCRHSGEFRESPDAAAWDISYFNIATKKEADLWARAEYVPASGMDIYLEAQLRNLGYEMKFPSADAPDYSDSRIFFNPRAGASLKFGRSFRGFASVAYGHREPARADILAQRDVSPERLLDFESGISAGSDVCSVSATLFFMEYFDMLLETGELNFEGYAIKSNYSRGWRRGLELEAEWNPSHRVGIGVNASLSDNRYMAAGGAKTILLSPSAVISSRINTRPWKNGSAGVSFKYVGRQYWDNSGLEQRAVPGYYTFGLSVSHSFHLGKYELLLSADADNLLNRKYYAYAYSGGVYPASPFAAMLSLRISRAGD